MAEQSKDEKAVWSIFMNATGAEALKLLEIANKILIARNVIKPARTRKAKEQQPATVRTGGKPTGKDSAP